MSSQFINLLGADLLEIIFIASFSFGLVFLFLIIFSSIHHGQTDHHQFSKDHHIYSKNYHHDHNNIISADSEFQGEVQVHNLSDLSNISTNHLKPNILSLGDYTITEDSNFPLGNISIFLLIFGQIGWIGIQYMNDFFILLALICGLFASYLFKWFVNYYAKTQVIPVQHISRGDIARVIYGVTPEKSGIIQVYRKDGIISVAIARGAFPHDYFDPDELGYIWTKEGEIFTITKGVKQRGKKLDSKNLKHH